MTQRVLSVAGVGGLGIVMLVLAGVQVGHAQVSAFPSSDRPAGYVVFPKIVVDTSDIFAQGQAQDTIIQLTNVHDNEEPRVVECFYVDATSRCNNAQSGDIGQFRYCRTSADCRPGGLCIPQWSQTDFTIVLTPNQPVGWRASVGVDLSDVDPDSQGGVPAVSNYFIGELKCVEVNGDSITSTDTLPINANDLKGEATIEDVSPTIPGVAAPDTPGSVDVREYNAIGFQTNGNQATQNDQVLCLGASPGSTSCTTAEYSSCPSILVVDHFFDGAEDPDIGGVVTSDLTLVPCTEDLTSASQTNGISSQPGTTLQILIFNEFEQRISTSMHLGCFRELPLSQIDQSPGNSASSAFNANVQGTLTGQTRLRPILGTDPNRGNGVLAVVEEFHCAVPNAAGSCAGQPGHRSGAFNVNYIGINGGKGDLVSFSVSTGETPPTNP